MNARPIALLLTAVLCLQVYGLMRLGEMKYEVESLRRAQQDEALEVKNRVVEIGAKLERLADSQRWYSVSRAEVLPDAACQSGEARVEWELREWMSGDTVRFLYRTGADDEWHEAAVAALGGASYAASIPITAPPALDWTVAVTGSWVVDEPDRVINRPDVSRQVEYQILSEGSGVSRGTGVLQLDLDGHFVPGVIRVRADRDGSYRVRVQAMKENRCVAVEGGEVRVYRGGSLVQTVPLETSVTLGLEAEWRSKEQPDRLEIVVRYAGQEEVIPVEF